jgi:hypothetical protein
VTVLARTPRLTVRVVPAARPAAAVLPTEEPARLLDALALAADIRAAAPAALQVHELDARG